MYGLLNDPTIAALRSAMNACATRNNVIANNIANSDTPGYKRRVVRFEDMLSQVLDSPSASSEQIRLITPEVEIDNSPSGRLDGNNVNLDQEMADLSRNTIEYSALVELNRMRGGMLKTVINGGRI